MRSEDQRRLQEAPARSSTQLGLANVPRAPQTHTMCPKQRTELARPTPIANRLTAALLPLPHPAACLPPPLAHPSLIPHPLALPMLAGPPSPT